MELIDKNSKIKFERPDLVEMMVNRGRSYIDKPGRVAEDLVAYYNKIIYDYLESVKDSIGLKHKLIKDSIIFKPGYSGRAHFMSGEFGMEYKYKYISSGSDIVILYRFFMDELPNTCSTVVVHGTEVSNTFQRLGIGTLLQSMKEDLAIMTGYTKMMACDIIRNEYQDSDHVNHNIDLLLESGYAMIDEHKNERTENTLGVFLKDISAQTVEFEQELENRNND
jgi:hypothetical protein